MEWEAIAPMIVSVVFILTVGGVAILRPIAKRISELLDLYARDRHAGIGTEVQQIRDLLETMNARLQLMEERQDFTERLLAPADRERRGSIVAGTLEGRSADTPTGPEGAATPKGPS